MLPLAAMTEKDRRDLAFALDLGADWVALSFVRRAEDVAEGRQLVGNAAGLMVKLGKAIGDPPPRRDHRSPPTMLMVARGDLGVEMPAEDVPTVQKQIIRACRLAGKPVIVATQMLESMISAPTPTRAEASDVATAVYEGADAVMLSRNETCAVGEYPVEVVVMMDRIARRVQEDPLYFPSLQTQMMEHEHTNPDAISAAAYQVAATVGAAIVSYTTSGATALRAARSNAGVPILVLTSNHGTARRLALLWGAHCVATPPMSAASPTWCSARCASPTAKASRNPASASSSPPACPSAPPAPPTRCGSPGSTGKGILRGLATRGASGRGQLMPL